MSGIGYKAKGALALALSMALFSTTLFADTRAYAAQAVSKAEENILPELTYEAALEKAKKHSPDLRDIADTAEFLQKTKEDLWDRVGYFDSPDYDYQRWVNDGWYMVTSSAFSTTTSMKQNSYGEAITKLGLEAGVKNYFITILSQEDNLELLKKNMELQQKLYKQGKTKYQLGLISKFDLDKLETETNNLADSITLMESALEQIYTQFNSLLGESPEKRYQLVYDVSYEPFTLNQTMDQYINGKVNASNTLKILELNVESAKFKKNYLPESSTGSETNQNNLSYDQAKRSLKTSKDDFALAIRNGYNAILQKETEYATAQAALKQAEADYHKAEVNYQAGNITALTLEQAQMGVDKAKNEIQQVVYDHDLAIFNFQNPDLLSGGAGASGASGKSGKSGSGSEGK
ncbi:MAG: TolC family protein [Anaerotignum sp.]|nr:TolC family protein [Anaerotignum sp.]